MASLLITGISQLVTPRRSGAHRGAEMSDLLIVPEAALLLRDGVIAWIGSQKDWSGEVEEHIDLGDRAVVPGLIDPHTHAVWAGDRLNDFEARCSGVPYETILASGGGIWSTIRETAKASCAELVELALPRIEALVRSGATVIEVKSGYGFSVEAELHMLEAVRALQARVSVRLVPTLLVHVPPADAKEREQYRAMLCSELIPRAAQSGLAAAVDIFVEEHAWSAADAEVVLRCAQAHGLGVKLHAEQFHRVGGLELAIALGALSVDHLEACSAEQCALFDGARTVATILPGVSLHLGLPSAPGRALIDAGAAIAVGTDLNPGSSPLFSISAALALAVRLNGLTLSEALVACTANAAAALSMDGGALIAGQRADFVVVDSKDWRDLAYTLRGSAVHQVWAGGRRVAG